MNGHFRNLARLALGTGPFITPNLRPEFEEGGWEEAVPEPPIGSVPGLGASNPTESVATHSETTHHHFDRRESLHESRVVEEREVPYAEPNATEIRTVRERETERTLERKEREIAATRETLRELLRESRVTRESALHPQSREVERAVPLPETVVERRTEAERLVRELQERTSHSTHRETNATETIVCTPEGAAVEVHIGRIDIRAVPGDTAAKTSEKAKPSGIISLNDYLRDRSRGTS